MTDEDRIYMYIYISAKKFNLACCLLIVFIIYPREEIKTTKFYICNRPVDEL